MPTVTLSNPPGVRTPASRYSHAALVEGPHRRLVISGQVGQAPDGSVPADGAGQIAQAYANLQAILAAHCMGIGDVVKTTAFLTDRALIPAYRAARDALFAAHAPASTLLVVAGLADPQWQVEIEAEAAR
ncbi:MAG: RidA family protein [Rhodospirillales bacterium]|nr:RidA family protein [Rhodospirillales bacterium]